MIVECVVHAKQFQGNSLPAVSLYLMVASLEQLPGVDTNDPHIKDLLASMQNQSEVSLNDFGSRKGSKKMANLNLDITFSLLHFENISCLCMKRVFFSFVSPLVILSFLELSLQVKAVVGPFSTYRIEDEII